MIGTLIGMVQMSTNMTDPSKLGPFMAGALLATFYGATIPNVFVLPIADKLHLKLVDEEINRTLIIDGILMIRAVDEYTGWGRAPSPCPSPRWGEGTPEPLPWVIRASSLPWGERRVRGP